MFCWYWSRLLHRFQHGRKSNKEINSARLEQARIEDELCWRNEDRQYKDELRHYKWQPRTITKNSPHPPLSIVKPTHHCNFSFDPCPCFVDIDQDYSIDSNMDESQILPTKSQCNVKSGALFTLCSCFVDIDPLTNWHKRSLCYQLLNIVSGIIWVFDDSIIDSNMNESWRLPKAILDWFVVKPHHQPAGHCDYSEIPKIRSRCESTLEFLGRLNKQGGNSKTSPW